MNKTTLEIEMAKHVPLYGGTAGPWTHDESTAMITSPEGPVAVMAPGWHPQEQEANARLIAAAPALHFALDRLQANPNDPRAHRMALDALNLVMEPHTAATA